MSDHEAVLHSLHRDHKAVRQMRWPSQRQDPRPHGLQFPDVRGEVEGTARAASSSGSWPLLAAAATRQSEA